MYNSRGQNIVASFVTHEIKGKPDSCIFEWILCLDLKGYVPRYILDSVSIPFLYINDCDKHCVVSGLHKFHAGIYDVFA